MSIQIHFEVKCETSLSQQLYIVGDIQQLGDWKPNKGLKLNTSKELYPLWVGTLFGDFKQNCLIKFKAVIVDSDINFWEQNEDRAFQVRYQSQSLIFHFNASITRMRKVKSFFDDVTDSEEEITTFCDAKRRPLKVVQSPLDFDFMSSDSESENSDFSSIFISNLSSNNSSFRHLENINLIQFQYIIVDVEN